MRSEGSIVASEADAAAQDDRARIFAANRAHGKVALRVAHRDGRTRPQTLHEAGSLRVRFPRSRTSTLEAVMVNTAGGIAGGDCFDIELTAGPDAQIMVTSAAAEKVYRSSGPDAQTRIALNVDPGGSIVWLPQETIVFNCARIARSIDVNLAKEARLIVAEAVIFGRLGMGEVVEAGRLVDFWRVRQQGRLVFAESTRLEGAIAEKLREPAVAKGGLGIATLLVVPADAGLADRVRSLDADFCGEVGISVWNGLALVRFCAKDGATLRRDLSTVLTALPGQSLPRLWCN
jgi:urease accessory protein